LGSGQGWKKIPQTVLTNRKQENVNIINLFRIESPEMKKIIKNILSKRMITFLRGPYLGVYVIKALSVS
jgi:hypothetical protein